MIVSCPLQWCPACTYSITIEFLKKVLSDSDFCLFSLHMNITRTLPLSNEQIYRFKKPWILRCTVFIVVVFCGAFCFVKSQNIKVQSRLKDAKYLNFEKMLAAESSFLHSSIAFLHSLNRQYILHFWLELLLQHHLQSQLPLYETCSFLSEIGKALRGPVCVWLPL